VDIVENAGCAGVADDCVDILGSDAVNNGLNRGTSSGGVDQIHVVTMLDRDSGSVSQPLGIVQGPTFRDCRATLLA